MPTLREQLALKRAQRRTVKFPLGPEGAKAAAALEDAKQAALLSTASGNAEAQKLAQTALAKAERSLDAHSMTIVIQGLNEDARDALSSAHPATPEMEAEDEQQIRAKLIDPADRRTINRATWLPAALAATVVPPDGEDPLSEKEWARELADPDKWTAGEKQALMQAVVQATNGGPAPGIPKD